MTRLLLLLIALTATVLPGCSSLDERTARERALNDPVVQAATWPPDSRWVVVARGEGVGAADEEQAHEIAPDAAQRYVFRPSHAGDTRPRMAYLPTAAMIAGREFAAALGLTLRRDAQGGAVLTRDARRVSAEAGGKVLVQISAPDGSVASEAAILLDPDFHGPLLVSPTIAEQLGLRRFEIPGEARIDVALGRPFRARRSRVLITIDELSARGPVEALYPQ